jgi:hypothetical protein
MGAMTWLGVLLLVAWLILWLGLKIVSGLVHILVLAAVALIAWGLIKRGGQALSRKP